jgi:two-component system, cell cycle sensor histidine kinase and response regulator CckA
MGPKAPQDRPFPNRETGNRNVIPLLQTQFAVSEVLASAEDLQSALPSIIASICINLEWELGAFWQHAATRPVLTCTNISAAEESLGRFIAESRKNELLPGEGLPGRVFATSQPEWIVDIRTEKESPESLAAADAGLQSAFAFPVLAGNDAIAVLEFLTAEFREPDRDLLETMVALGRQIGQFIRRKEAEEALHQSLEIYRHLTDSATDAIITIDESGNILLANRSAECLLGYAAAEMKSQSLTMLVPEHSRIRYEHTVASYLESGKKGPHRVLDVFGRHKDGREMLLQVSFADFLLKGQRVFTGFIRDKSKPGNITTASGFSAEPRFSNLSEELNHRLDALKCTLHRFRQSASVQQVAQLDLAAQELERVNEIIRGLACERKET